MRQINHLVASCLQFTPVIYILLCVTLASSKIEHDVLPAFSRITYGPLNGTPAFCNIKYDTLPVLASANRVYFPRHVLESNLKGGRHDEYGLQLI